MRKFYQTEWQNIEFSSFSSMSSNTLADDQFYDAFYKVFFQKYPNYDALDPDWRRKKDEIGDWLAAQLPDGSRVLSVGCGLGYVEQRLWCLHKDRIDLHVQDFASDSLRWLKQVLPSANIHDIHIEKIDARKENAMTEKFDVIYLCAVDYAMPDKEMINLLSELRSGLRKSGCILLISASFLNESMLGRIVRNLKDTAKWFLERIGLRDRGQLWGWMRSADDYQALMQRAGLLGVQQGFIETVHQRTYWIKGVGEESS